VNEWSIAIMKPSGRT